MNEKQKAALFVYFIRPEMKPGAIGELRDCPMCGSLLQMYTEGWLHLADGDADCYGALSVGKNP